ncbi:DUF1080 domain-containing protein [Deinococcus sp. AJ005]|uniref:3-keto-disaccharide hydrolase n=1 Tax=Deinococcus sp. AJ005 TaxID=2652443 RepID=UPI00125CACA3|nr:DUF1080 domain-containing protein [Deinococcus sp. AJ005]QFP75874.1 DUF1080 domain-containing protein [Deinococcus sp. AJ005]
MPDTFPSAHSPPTDLLWQRVRRIGLALLLGGTLSACAGVSGTAALPDSADELAPALQPQTAWTPLFNGTDLSGWTSWLPSRGAGNDPEGVFKVEGGELRVLNVAPTAGEREFGYLLTDKRYANYRLRLHYRWDQQKFAPRAADARDSGVLYHVTGPDRVWPASAEFQILEGGTGDLWQLSGSNLTATVRDPGAQELQYDPLGQPVTTSNVADSYRRMVRAGGVQELPGWNTLELVVSGDEATQIVNGQLAAQATHLRAPDGSALTAGRIALQAEGAAVSYRDIELRPLAYLTPPPGAQVLLGSSSTAQSVNSDWQDRRGGDVRWPVQGGALTVQPSSDPQDTNDLRTRGSFGDFRLHLEFRVPASRTGLAEQDRGNSGVYLQGRYEVQILDSFGATLEGQNDLGAIYGQHDARSNAALPSGTWQSYDIEFRAARWEDGQKTGDARATVYLNGEKVQDDVPLSASTLLGDPEADSPGPIVLQDHGSKVSFRNVWVLPGAELPPSSPTAP